MTGTISDSATWTRDGSGDSLTFDGRQARVTVANTPALTPSVGFSLVAWVKLSADGVVLAKGGSYALAVVNGRLALKTTVAGAYRPLFGHWPIADGQWHHVACAYDGFEVRLYVDGERDVTTHTGGSIAPSTEALVMGQFAVYLRDAGMYTRAFSDGDIKLLYQTVSAVAGAEARQEPSAPSFLAARREARPPMAQIASRGAQ